MQKIVYHVFCSKFRFSVINSPCQSLNGYYLGARLLYDSKRSICGASFWSVILLSVFETGSEMRENKQFRSNCGIAERREERVDFCSSRLLERAGEKRVQKNSLSVRHF